MITFIFNVLFKLVYLYLTIALWAILIALTIALVLCISKKDETKATKRIKFNKFEIKIDIKLD